MLRHVTADILNETTGMLVHGVNCQGRMGAGIALSIKKRYPQVYQSYLDACERQYYVPEKLLGTVDFVWINKDLCIANAFIQDKYGNDGVRYVSYDAVDSCFATVNLKASEKGMVVKYPFIGAGLGGGCWEIISAIIQANRSDNVEHVLYRF